MKTIVIFGGSGFVGTHFCNLYNSKYNIFNSDIIKNNDVQKENFIQCDIRETIDLRLFPKNIDLIINLAAVHKSPGHPSNEYYKTNISGATNICNFAESTGCKKIVFTSSIAVYGPGEDEKSEESLTMPVIPYGISKIIAEYIHREWQGENSERKLSIIRPAVIFGKGERGNFTRIATALRKGIFVYPGRKNTIKSCIYVKDVCRLIEREIQTIAPLSIYNCCYPDKITTEKVCESFNKALGFKVPKKVIPQSAIVSAAAVLKIINTPFIRSLGLDPLRIAKLVNSTNISSRKLVDSGFEFKYDLTPAIKDWAEDCKGKILF